MTDNKSVTRGRGDAQLFAGDARVVLRALASETVDLIMTSPPYANQRKATYGGVDPDEYAQWFLPISRELLRVLKPAGSFVLNIREHCEKGERHSYVVNLVLALRREGWRWVDEFVWCKTNPVPGRWPNRLANGWERLLHFSKQKRIAFYPDHVMIPIATRTGPSTAPDVRRYSATGSGYNFNRKNFVGRTMKYPANVLHLPSVTRNYGHSAAYPESLPSFFIKLFTRERDLVLDPFVGSGTTCVAAARLGRRSIGIGRELPAGAHERVRRALSH